MFVTCFSNRSCSPVTLFHFSYRPGHQCVPTSVSQLISHESPGRTFSTVSSEWDVASIYISCWCSNSDFAVTYVLGNNRLYAIITLKWTGIYSLLNYKMWWSFSMFFYYFFMSHVFYIPFSLSFSVLDHFCSQNLLIYCRLAFFCPSVKVLCSFQYFRNFHRLSIIFTYFSLFFLFFRSTFFTFFLQCFI